MFFKRKVYKQLLEWKEKYANRYAVLLEGARRVGKSTIALEFAKNEYESFILIDFANTNKSVLSIFDDIDNLDLFFLRLQTTAGVTLKKNNSVIIFDEIQLFPKARQAIKYLVKDGRFHYIETGSLISIKKNIKDIVIPSEEMKITVCPLDYQEFNLALNNNSVEMIKQFYNLGSPVGQELNRKFMREFRLYMAVGGMPQAVEAFVDGKNFSEIDIIKREIINLYIDDFKKIDQSGRIGMLFKSIPAQLSRNKKRYVIANAIGKRKSLKDEELLYDLIDSKTVLVSYNTTDPRVSLSLTSDLSSFKLYVADTGLFVTLMFIDRPITENEIYSKLLSDKLPANLGYLYENAVAQMIVSANRQLYYHTWEKENSSHYFEIDFLLSNGNKINAIEVKSSGVSNHQSLNMFREKYSQNIENTYIISKKDLNLTSNNKNIPIYMTSILCE